jgi:hypothetical protein
MPVIFDPINGELFMRDFTKAQLRLQLQLFRTQKRKVEEQMAKPNSDIEFLSGKLDSVNKQIRIAERRLGEIQELAGVQ